MARSKQTRFRRVKLSLSDLVGRDYVNAVCKTRARLTGESEKMLRAIATEKIDFYPKEVHEALIDLLPQLGKKFGATLNKSACGVTTCAFVNNSHIDLSPLTGLGYYRVSESGKLHIISKSEHYHASVGHTFPGYRLIDNARKLGILNATHNNTRGHITRLLEEELVRVAAGIEPGDRAALDRVINSKSKSVLNRVINLGTGSISAEAAIKLVLSRFYKVQGDSPKPKYAGRVPVIMVLGDADGNTQGNYHGTTIAGQLLRGMWPKLCDAFEKSNTMLVRALRPNSIGDLEAAFKKYDKGKYKIAGFFHELIMMNYAATEITRQFIRKAYSLCKKHDVPTIVDEIQTCVWSPEVLMFREYGIKPSIVVVGKGFPGGEFSASRILFNSDLDCLPQFGALITNGQEELSALAYLITMRWVEENAEVTGAVGEYFYERLAALAEAYPDYISGIEGRRHLAGIGFLDLLKAKDFAARINEMGLDISVQSYKANCPPSALVKMPLVAGYEAVDAVIARMNIAMAAVAR